MRPDEAVALHRLQICDRNAGFLGDMSVTAETIERGSHCGRVWVRRRRYGNRSRRGAHEVDGPYRAASGPFDGGGQFKRRFLQATTELADARPRAADDVREALVVEAGALHELCEGFHVANVRQTHIEVNDQCASRALASVRAAHDNWRMGRINQSRRGNPHRRFFKEWRQHRGLTQTQLAERLADLTHNERLDHSRVSKIERGVESATEDMVFAWADALQVEPGALFVRPDVYLRQAEIMGVLQVHSPDDVAAVLRVVGTMRKAS